MSAHIEFDFNDDGSVTMTHKPEKGAELTKYEYPVLVDGQAVLVNVIAGGGSDNTVTHQIIFGTKATIHTIRGPLVESEAERKTMMIYSVWGIG